MPNLNINTNNYFIGDNMLTLKYLDELNCSSNKNNINNNYYYTNTNSNENLNYFIYPPNPRSKINTHKSFSNNNRLNTYNNKHEKNYQISYNNYMPSNEISPINYNQMSQMNFNKKYNNSKYNYYNDTNNSGIEDDLIFHKNNDNEIEIINNEINNYKQKIKNDLAKKYKINNPRNIFNYNKQYKSRQRINYNLNSNKNINHISPTHKDYFNYILNNEEPYQEDLFENEIDEDSNKIMNYKKICKNKKVSSPLTQTYWNNYINEKNNDTKNYYDDKNVYNYVKMNENNSYKNDNFISDDPIDEQRCYQTFSGTFRKSPLNTNNKYDIRSYNNFGLNTLNQEKKPSLKKYKSYHKRNNLNYLDIIPNLKDNLINKIETYKDFKRNNTCINNTDNNEIVNNLDTYCNNKNNKNNNIIRGKSHNNLMNNCNNANHKNYDYKNKLNKIKMKTEGLFNVYLHLLKTCAKNDK